MNMLIPKFGRKDSLPAKSSHIYLMKLHYAPTFNYLGHIGNVLVPHIPNPTPFFEWGIHDLNLTTQCEPFMKSSFHVYTGRSNVTRTILCSISLVKTIS